MFQDYKELWFFFWQKFISTHASKIFIEIGVGMEFLQIAFFFR